MEAEAEKDGKKAAEDTAPKSAKEVAEELKNRMEEAKKRSADALEAIKDGRGVLELETPIEAGGETLESLSYDFTKLTGCDYIDAMDSDGSATQTYRITYRQSLALFGKAVSKEMEALDMRDILERIGMTDALEGIQLAMLFFNSATRAGRMRILKK